MNDLYGGLSAINSALQKAEKFLGCIALAALFFIMIANAALRYLFNSGLNWSDELNGFLFVWFGFLAAAYAMSNQSHLNITALINFFPKKVQLGLRVVMNGVMLVMFAIYLPPLGRLMKTLPIANVMRFPLKYVYVILPVSFILMCYHITFNTIRDIYLAWNGRQETEGEK